MLNEISQSQKDKHCTSLLIWEVPRDKFIKIGTRLVVAGESASNADRVLQDEEFWGSVRRATVSSAQVQ